MKKPLILLTLSVLCLIIAGCTTDTSQNQPNYRTGTEALELRLLDAGTDDYFEGDEVVILVEVFNRGTADIANGEFFVSGFDLQFLQFALDPKFINIEGKSEFDPEGRNSQVLELRSIGPARLPENSDSFVQNVKLTACYEYRTLATAEICVDPDPNGRRVTRKVCNMAPVSPGSQGAPIVVNRVEPIVVNNDFRLNIDFSNQGNGVTYDRTLSPFECFTALDRFQDLNKVDLITVDFSGRTLTCSPRNPLRLIDGNGRVTCECENCVESYQDAFKTQVNIEFSYGYRNEVVKNVRILSD